MRGLRPCAAVVAIALCAAAAAAAPPAGSAPSSAPATAAPWPAAEPFAADWYGTYESPACLGITPDGGGALFFLQDVEDYSLTMGFIVGFKMAPGKKAPFGATTVSGPIYAVGPEGESLEVDTAVDLLDKHVGKISAAMAKAGLLACEGSRRGPSFAVRPRGVDVRVEDNGKAVLVTPAPGAKTVRVRGLATHALDPDARERVSGVFFHPAFPHVFIVVTMEAVEGPPYREHRGVLVVTPEKLRR